MYVAVLQFATSHGWIDDDAFPFTSEAEAMAAAVYQNIILAKTDDHNMRYAVKPAVKVKPSLIRCDSDAIGPQARNQRSFTRQAPFEAALSAP